MTEEDPSRVLPSGLLAGPEADPRVGEILDLFAKEARIERSQLRLDARADELGVTSLDLALAMFELESRYDIDLPEPVPGEPMPTVGEMVQQVLVALRARAASDGPAAALAAPAAPDARQPTPTGAA